MTAQTDRQVPHFLSMADLSADDLSAVLERAANPEPFGLVRWDNSRRPAFDTYRTAIRLLGGVRRAERERWDAVGQIRLEQAGQSTTVLFARLPGRQETTVAATAATADLALPPSGVVVLASHRISAAGRSQMDLHPERFRHQMEYLVDHFTVVSLDEALVLLAGRTTSVGKPPIVVTFDDGTEDFHRVALPVLDELGIAATIYVATGPVLDGTAWPDGAIALNPSALAEVASNDLVTIGCHSHDHLLLDREPAQTVANDLDRSIGLLEEWTGKRPTHFAYPKALPPSADNAALVRATSARQRHFTPSVKGLRVVPQARSCAGAIGCRRCPLPDHPNRRQRTANARGLRRPLRATILVSRTEPLCHPMPRTPSRCRPPLG
mgnify:CR=1 FL=1